MVRKRLGTPALKNVADGMYNDLIDLREHIILRPNTCSKLIQLVMFG